MQFKIKDNIFLFRTYIYVCVHEYVCAHVCLCVFMNYQQ